VKNRLILALLVTGALGVGIPFAIADAAGASGDVTCVGLFTGHALHNLIVPAGQGCNMQGARVGHDVIVENGASLIEVASNIGHDIRATNHPSFVDLNGEGAPGSTAVKGTVRHDVIVHGSTDGLEFICGTNIGHDAILTNSHTGWVVGDNDLDCGHEGGGAVIHHNLVVTHSGMIAEIEDNRVGHDMTLLHNPDTRAENNIVGHDATCSPQSHKDQDAGSNNQVKHKDKGCS
jgi:hypothetical protein